MQVLLLAKKPPFPPRDGEAIAILQMAKGLHSAGAEVTVLYMNTEKHHFPAEEIPARLKGIIRFESVEVDAGVYVTGLMASNLTGKPYHAHRFYAPAFMAAIEQLQQQTPFDVVQAEGLYLVQYLQDAKLKAAKKIYRSHNIEADIWTHVAANSSNPLKKMYLRSQAKKLRNYEQRIIQQTDAIVPISPIDGELYRSIAPSRKIFYCPTGIDINKMLTPTETAKDIYFIGGLDWIPNVEGLEWFLREAFPQVRAQHPDIIFHIAGRNAPADMKNMDEPNVRFYGEVEDAQQFAADKLICIAPLLSGSGMKIKIAEAMALGKYVITTAVGASGMPPGMDAYFMHTSNPSAFAAELNTLLSDLSGTRQKALAAQQFVFNNLDNQQLGQQLVAFYSSL